MAQIAGVTRILCTAWLVLTAVIAFLAQPLVAPPKDASKTENPAGNNAEKPAGALLTELMTENDYDLLTETLRGCARKATEVVRKEYAEKEKKEAAGKPPDDHCKTVTEAHEQAEAAKEAKKLREQRFDVSYCYSCSWLMRAAVKVLGDKNTHLKGCEAFDQCWDAKLKEQNIIDAKMHFNTKYEIQEEKHNKAMMVALNCHMQKDRKEKRVIEAEEGAVLRQVYARCVLESTAPPKELPKNEVPPAGHENPFVDLENGPNGKARSADEKAKLKEQLEKAKKNQSYRTMVQQMASEGRYAQVIDCRRCSRNDWIKCGTDPVAEAQPVCVKTRECFTKEIAQLDKSRYGALRKKLDAYYHPTHDELEFRHLHKVVHCQVAAAVATAEAKLPDEIKDALVEAYKSCAEADVHKNSPGGKTGPFTLDAQVDEYKFCSPCTLRRSFASLIKDWLGWTDDKCVNLKKCFMQEKLPEVMKKFPKLQKYSDAKGQEQLRMHVHCEFYERRYDDRTVQDKDKPILMEILRPIIKDKNQALLSKCFPCSAREKLASVMARMKAAIADGLDWKKLLKGGDAGAKADEKEGSAANECDAISIAFVDSSSRDARHAESNPKNSMSDAEALHREAALKIDWLAEDDSAEQMNRLVGELRCALAEKEKVDNQIQFADRLKLAGIMHGCETGTIVYEMASLDTPNPNALLAGGDVVNVGDFKKPDAKGPAASAGEIKGAGNEANVFDPANPEPTTLEPEKESAEVREGFRQITECYTCNDHRFYELAKHWKRFKRWYNFRGACGKMRECFRHRVRDKAAIGEELSKKIDAGFQTDASLDYLMRAVNCPQSANGAAEAFKDAGELLKATLEKAFGVLQENSIGLVNANWKTCIDRLLEKDQKLTVCDFLCNEDKQLDFGTCMKSKDDRGGAVRVFVSRIVSKIMVWTRDKTICWRFPAATSRWKRAVSHCPELKTVIKVSSVVIILGWLSASIVPGTLFLTGAVASGAPTAAALKVGCGVWETTLAAINGKVVASVSCTQAIIDTVYTAAEVAAYLGSKSDKFLFAAQVAGQMASVIGTWIGSFFK